MRAARLFAGWCRPSIERGARRWIGADEDGGRVGGQSREGWRLHQAVAAVLVVAFVLVVVHNFVSGCSDLGDCFGAERLGDDQIAVGSEEAALFIA